jgi:hypothetical protein
MSEAFPWSSLADCNSSGYILAWSFVIFSDLLVFGLTLRGAQRLRTFLKFNINVRGASSEGTETSSLVGLVCRDGESCF